MTWKMVVKVVDDRLGNRRGGTDEWRKVAA